MNTLACEDKDPAAEGLPMLNSYIRMEELVSKQKAISRAGFNTFEN
jgi:hypothetical protein